MASMTNLPGLHTIADAFRSFAKQVVETADIFDDLLLRTADTVEDVRRTVTKATQILADLETHFAKTKDAITTVDLATPYPAWINTLTDNLLSQIMVLATADDSDFDPENPYVAANRTFPEMAMVVSRRWTAVAERTPLMWSYIRVDSWHDDTRTALWLKRSSDSPLHVQWMFRGYRDEWEVHEHYLHARAILPSLSRITQLFIYTPDSLPSEFNDTIFTPLARSPALQFLQIHKEGIGSGRVEYDLLEAVGRDSFLSLRVLDAYGIRFHWDWSIRNLRVLRLQWIHTRYLPSWTVFRDILTSSPSLEELDLDIFVLTGEPQTAPLELPVFPRLTSIRLRQPLKDMCSLLLPAIRAPALKKLTILSPRPSPDTPLPISLFLSFSQSLHELHLLGYEHYQQPLTAFLQSAPPRLAVLGLYDSFGYRLEGTLDDVVRALAACRQLRKIHAYSPKLGSRNEAWEEMAEERHRTDCVPLEIVCGYRPEDLDLERYRVTFVQTRD